MNVVQIDDYIQATAAAEWCQQSKIDYRLEFCGWQSHCKYKFFFDSQTDLVIFSLKWLK